MELKQDVTHGTWDYPFQVHHTETSDGLYLYPHVHNEFEITCITKGQGIFYINNRKYSIKEGDILFVCKIKKGDILEANKVLRGLNVGNYRTNGEIKVIEIVNS